MISTASQIAREAGRLLRDSFGRAPVINQAEAHDIKLQMDVDCQRLIEAQIRKHFPGHSIVGEEESHGDPGTEYRWVVDPLDGTVNYSYGIPHFCVSIALQRQGAGDEAARAMGGYTGVAAVVYDPMREELFTAEKDRGAFLNGKPIAVSGRGQIDEAVLSLGFSKTDESIERGLRSFQTLVRRARKLRNMGSAALDLAYVAAGRMEAYIESRVRLWDIAAGILLVQEAGGRVRLRAVNGVAHSYETVASNGKVDFQPFLQGMFEGGDPADGSAKKRLD